MLLELPHDFAEHPCFASAVFLRYVLCFFFSSRRRHTRSDRDWSSDVCSSDLPRLLAGLVGGVDVVGGWRVTRRDPWARQAASWLANRVTSAVVGVRLRDYGCRSGEHTSGLQSRSDLVFRLLLGKKKKTQSRSV